MVLECDDILLFVVTDSKSVCEVGQRGVAARGRARSLTCKIKPRAEIIPSFQATCCFSCKVSTLKDQKRRIT